MEFIACKKNPKYKVSRKGDVIGPRQRVLKGFIHPKGYKHYFLGNGDCSKAHRLVAEAFVPNPDNKPEVNHIDGNKLNNSAENLEWVTHLENMQHAKRTGLHKLPFGENARRAILTQEQVEYIRKFYKKRDPEYGQTALGRKFNVTNSCVWRIVHNDNWNRN
jgi:hypothetical protein